MRPQVRVGACTDARARVHAREMLYRRFSYYGAVIGRIRCRMHVCEVDLYPILFRSTPQEKMLGRLVKEKYGTDFFMMDKCARIVRTQFILLVLASEWHLLALAAVVVEKCFCRHGFVVSCVFRWRIV